jgi:PPP family 3-phenylpropionic acid transporter
VTRGLYWQLAGFYFFYFGYIGAFAPYFSLYLDALGYSAAMIGTIMTAPQLMRIFAPHLWGYLSDRKASRVGVVRWTGVAGTLCFLGLFGGHAFAWIFLCLALWSFFWSAALPLIETTTLDHLGERGADYGRIRLWGSVGFVVTVIGVGWVLDRTAIVTLLWIVGATMAGILAAVWGVPESRRPKGEGRREPIMQVLKRRDVLALIGACFLMAAAHGPYYTFFSIHLVDLGYSKTVIGWLWAIGVIAEIVVFACLPWLYARFTHHALLLWSFALAVLRFALIAWGAHLPPVLIVAQVLHAATFGVFHSAALASVHRLFRGTHQARGQAVYSGLSAGLGGALGGFGSGVVWVPWGAAGTFLAAAGCALLGGLLLAANRRG